MVARWNQSNSTWIASATGSVSLFPSGVCARLAGFLWRILPKASTTPWPICAWAESWQNLYARSRISADIQAVRSVAWNRHSKGFSRIRQRNLQCRFNNTSRNRSHMTPSLKKTCRKLLNLTRRSKRRSGIDSESQIERRFVQRCLCNSPITKGKLLVP